MYQKRFYIGKGKIYEYGNEVIYTKEENIIKLNASNGVETSIEDSNLIKTDGTYLESRGKLYLDE